MAEDQVRPVVAVLGQLNDYHVEILRGIAAALRRKAIPLLIVVVDGARSQPLPHVVADLLRPERARGGIVFCVEPLASRPGLPVLLTGTGLPVVTVAGRIEGFGRVQGENVTGMRALMEHLLDDCGARRLLLVRGLPGCADSQVREGVVREELARRGLALDEDLVVEGGFRAKPTLDRLGDVLARRRDFDAVVALNDVSAFGALSAVTGHGLRIPDDVLVTGFDNVRDSAAAWPPLTTVDQHLEDQGAAAVDLLLRLPAGQDGPEDVEVPSTLVIRASTVPHVQDLEQVTAAARALQTRVTSQDLAVQMGLAMTACRSVADIAGSLAPCLAQIGVRRCFLGLVRSGQDVAADGAEVSLVFSYLDGQVQEIADEVFPRHELLPPSLRPELERGDLLLQPVSVGGRERGYLLYDMNAQSPALAEALRIEVPRAVDLVFTSAEIEDRTSALERLVARETGELDRVTATLRSTVMLDGLTGIAARPAFDTALRQACGVRAASDTPVPPRQRMFAVRPPTEVEDIALDDAPHGPISLLMIDVDLFKAYNDHYGHLAGDETLRTVARCLERTVDGTDHLACRYGGEEFAVILRGCDPTDALDVADRFAGLLRTAAIPHRASPVASVVTASIGVAGTPRAQDVSPTDLIAAADGALYLAKTQGRGRVVVAATAST